MNRQYSIRRSDMLTAIREAGWFIGMKGDKLPLDEGAGPNPLTVQTERGIMKTFTVRVLPSGVAKRIEAQCPECERWMRFSALQQHVGTRVCRATAFNQSK